MAATPNSAAMAAASANTARSLGSWGYESAGPSNATAGTGSCVGTMCTAINSDPCSPASSTANATASAEGGEPSVATRMRRIALRWPGWSRLVSRGGAWRIPSM